MSPRASGRTYRSRVWIRDACTLVDGVARTLEARGDLDDDRPDRIVSALRRWCDHGEAPGDRVSWALKGCPAHPGQRQASWMLLQLARDVAKARRELERPLPGGQHVGIPGHRRPVYLSGLLGRCADVLEVSGMDWWEALRGLAASVGREVPVVVAAGEVEWVMDHLRRSAPSVFNDEGMVELTAKTALRDPAAWERLCRASCAEHEGLPRRADLGVR